MSDTMQVVNTMEDSDVVIMETETGKRIAVMTEVGYDKVVKDVETSEGDIEYLTSEVEMLYAHLYNSTLPAYFDKDGRIPSSDVVDYMIKKSGGVNGS